MPLFEFRQGPRPRWLRETLLLLAITLILAGGGWLLRTPRVPLKADMSRYELDLGFPVMSADHALELYDAGTHLFVDAREIDPGSEPSIPGAFLIRASSFEDDLREVLDFIFPEDPLVVYGTDQLQIPGAVAGRFRQRGYEVTGILSGGVEAWRKAGGPLTGGEVEDD